VIAEAVQPVADLWFEFEVMQAPYPVAHAWSDYRACGWLRPGSGMILIGVSGQQGAGPGRYLAIL
jgi:hypothetical protein